MYNDKPLISIVMPAYNCQLFIDKTINSILEQSYQNWELIITEDCSTDSTYEILKKYTDSRIKVFKTEKNTGTVYTPRLNSFHHTVGEYVLNIDSDDYIEPDFLQKMVTTVINKKVDSCCCKMVMVDENGELLNLSPIPDNNFDYNQVVSGRDAFLLTVPRYRIAMNGFLSKRELWEKAWKKYEKPGRRGIHEDENIGRLILMFSENVAFCSAIHYYTINQNSVTHKFNDKIFDWMVSNEDLLKLVKDMYGVGVEYKEAGLADYYAYVHVTEFLAGALASIGNSKINYLKKMREWHNRIDWHEVKYYDGYLKWFIGKNFCLRWIFKLFSHKQFKEIGTIFKM